MRKIYLCKVPWGEEKGGRSGGDGQAPLGVELRGKGGSCAGAAPGMTVTITDFHYAVARPQVQRRSLHITLAPEMETTIIYLGSVIK